MKRLSIIGGICILMVMCFIYGFASGKYKIFPYSQLRNIFHRTPPTKQGYSGRWYKSRKLRSSNKPFQKDALQKLGHLPYLTGYTSSKSDIDGVVLYDRSRAFNGATLFCSGHAPVVFLINMKGEILHTWTIQFKKVWSGSLPFPIHEEHKQFIRRAYVYPNGDILCLFEYIGIVKLDKDSHILWHYEGQNHHDIEVAQNGYIYTLGSNKRNIREKYPQAPFPGPIDDDCIIILTADGKEIKKISIFEAFYHSDYAGYLNFVKKEGNIFHTNSIQLIENSVQQKERLFNDGDILISMRTIDTIAVIDGKGNKVKWALTGMWRFQHQSVFLENGNILLLDNLGGNQYSYFEFNRSKVVEIDPLTQKIHWEYRKDGENDIFFTRWLGYNQRLPNGNTLITEADQGHIFEVTPGKEIVWEYYNPHRTGKNNELIATIMGAVRIETQKLEFLESKPQLSE